MRCNKPGIKALNVLVLYGTLIAIVLSLFACVSQRHQLKDEAAQQIAERPWNAPGAEFLPAGAPMVVGLHLESVMQSVRDALLWTLDEPEMYGNAGTATVQEIMWHWQRSVEAVGSDPLSKQIWNALGINIEQPLYIAAYPISGSDNESFVRAVDEVLAQRFHGSSAANVFELLETLRELRENNEEESLQGLYSRVGRAVDGLEPVLGFRVLIPLIEQASFVKQLEAFTKAMGYEAIEMPAEAMTAKQNSPRMFYRAGMSFPAFALRFMQDYAVLDFIAKPLPYKHRSWTQRSQARQRAIAHLMYALEHFAFGIPHAPEPVEQSTTALFLSFDQEEMAKLAAFRSYAMTIEQLMAVHVRARDEWMLDLLIQSLESRLSWAIASESLSGTTISFSPSCVEAYAEKKCIFNLQMGLVGHEGLPELSTAVTDTQMRFDQGSTWSLSMDLSPFSSPEWLQWLRVDGLWQFFESFQDDEIDPLFLLFSWPRNLALMLAHLDDVVRDSWAFDMEPLQLEELTGVQRMEMVGVYDWQPFTEEHASLWSMPWFHVWVLDPHALMKDRDAIATNFYQQLTALAPEVFAGPREPGSMECSGDGAQDGLPFVKGRMKAIQNGVNKPQFFYYSESEDFPFLFMSFGLSEERASSQVNDILLSQTLAHSNGIRPVFEGRLTPIIMHRLLNNISHYTWHPLDLAVLAQRLGKLRFIIWPEERHGVKTIRFGIELESPGNLE